LQEALILSKELGNKREVAAVLNALAQVHRVQGNMDAADRILPRCLGTARGLEDREIICIGLLNLAMVSICAAYGTPPERFLEVHAIA
jgi:hypothetical protein